MGMVLFCLDDIKKEMEGVFYELGSKEVTPSRKTGVDTAKSREKRCLVREDAQKQN